MSVKNEREFDVEITYKDGDEDKTVVIKAGEEFEVPEDQQEAVSKQVSEAVAPEVEETDEEKAEREKTEQEEADKKAEEDKKKEDEETELSATKAELAETKAKLAEKTVNDQYETLLSAGKIVPAQEDAFKELAAEVTNVVNLSSDESLKQKFDALFENQPKIVNLDSEKGTTETGDKLDENGLTEDELAELQATKTDPAEYAKFGKSASVSIGSLINEDKE